uniref:Uncharacterized protein n=1 Tax=Rhodnius prolixus TaxID=13249 RepID=T1I209_RHOPR
MFQRSGMYRFSSMPTTFYIALWMKLQGASSLHPSHDSIKELSTLQLIKKHRKLTLSSSRYFLSVICIFS